MKDALLIIRDQLTMGYKLSFAEAMLLQQAIDVAVNHVGDSAEKVPAGFKLVPIDLINDLRNAAHFEKASYAASFGSHIDTGRWKDEYEQLTATCKSVDDLLAAAPTPTK